MGNITRAISSVLTIALTIALFAGLGVFTVGFASNVYAVAYESPELSTEIVQYAFYATWANLGFTPTDFVMDGPYFVVLASFILLLYAFPQSAEAVAFLSGKRRA